MRHSDLKSRCQALNRERGAAPNACLAPLSLCSSLTAHKVSRRPRFCTVPPEATAADPTACLATLDLIPTAHQISRRPAVQAVPPEATAVEPTACLDPSCSSPTANQVSRRPAVQAIPPETAAAESPRHRGPDSALWLRGGSTNSRYRRLRTPRPVHTCGDPDRSAGGRRPAVGQAGRRYRTAPHAPGRGRVHQVRHQYQ